MKGTRICFVLVLVMNCMISIVILRATDDGQHNVQDLYKKIGDDLIAIRKEFVGAQSKVFSVLDQIDKMYNITKSTLQKNQELAKTVKRHVTENAWLKNEVVSVRKELSSAKKTLESAQNSIDDAHVKLANEKEQAQLLVQEKSKLADRVQDLEMQKKVAKKSAEDIDLMGQAAEKSVELLASDDKVRGKAKTY